MKNGVIYLISDIESNFQTRVEWNTTQKSNLTTQLQLNFWVYHAGNLPQIMGLYDFTIRLAFVEELDKPLGEIEWIEYQVQNGVMATTGAGAGWVYATDFICNIPHNEDGSISKLFLGCNVRDNTGKYSAYSDILSYQDFLIDLDVWASIPTIDFATDFTDEENPTIDYSNLNGELVEKLEACIANETGGEVLVPYREIDKTGITYTFELTESEKQYLWSKCSGKSMPVRFYVQSTINGDKKRGYSAVKTFRIVDAPPTLSPIVEDINIITTTLTGNSSVVVKGFSNMSYVLIAEPQKAATITSYSITNGANRGTASSGVFNAVENNIFTFTATDSRGNISTQTVELDMVDYIKATCRQEVVLLNSGVMRLTVKGNYFNDSFGAKENDIKVENKVAKVGGNTAGEWVDITMFVNSRTGGTFEAAADLTVDDVSASYIVQSRITDSLTQATSIEYTVVLKPVFDWSSTDFNFNVPVISMSETPVLRYTDANRLVVSSNEGGIYLRPNGSEVDTGQFIIKPDGGVSINGSNMADFVVERGAVAMGSNGYWRYIKWNSGKAECYGTRNFGNMGVTTAFGSLYKSSELTQALPTNLFNTFPEYINIYVNEITNNMGWVVKGTTTPISKTNTGTFILVSPVNTTLQQVYLSFYVIGTWK